MITTSPPTNESSPASSSPEGELAFVLRGEFIPLDALLKATGIAGSGGVAKAMVAAGQVQVDGLPESRKTCKLRAGQRVRVAGQVIRLLASMPG